MREIKFRAWDLEYKEMVRAMELCEMIGINTPKPITEHYIFMQYTGLKDKDGKEIYEGDILQHIMGQYKSIGVMEWNDSGRWAVFHPIDKFEIIGNIYENPELLK